MHRRRWRRHTMKRWVWLVSVLVLGTGWPSFAADRSSAKPSFTVDPVTRYIHVRYRVPRAAPDQVVVFCAWSPVGKSNWRPARVRPLLSETALAMTGSAAWKPWSTAGRIVERRAAGLKRTVVFNPYPEAERAGKLDVTFRIVIKSSAGKTLAQDQVELQTDNSDVVYLEDWSHVFQRDALSTTPGRDRGKWSFVTAQSRPGTASRGDYLTGDAGPNVPLPPLSYPLNLKGWYAVFVHGAENIELRLTGDERADVLSSGPWGKEVLWRWTRMDRQHLVLRQRHIYTGWTAARIDYVKLVPLADETHRRLEKPFAGKADKFVAAYWEPYSWAFNDDVAETLWHRAQLSAFAEARVSLVDTQIGRFGAKLVYETRVGDQLLGATVGDPIGHVARPTTNNVGKMQQFTNTLRATLRYARELGLKAHANFGASNCYPGSPLQGDFSKQHPDWMRGAMLRFEVPQVRRYVLALYREALTIGAPGISIDFCRYPETIDKVTTGNQFLAALRALADEFGAARGTHVPILVRFPGIGVRRSPLFDYRTWTRRGWVDYLCPSNIQGRHLWIDVAPYLAAVKGTRCMLLPSIDGLSWGPPVPGPLLWRVARLYEAGVPGIHVYQADARVLGTPTDRRCMRRLCSSESVRRWWADDARIRPQCSKRIYITRPDAAGGYHGWERLRVWVEGVPMGPMEMYLDDHLVTRRDGPPYFLGTEDRSSDGVIPPGEHKLRIRVRDGSGWLEQTFAIRGAG